MKVTLLIIIFISQIYSLQLFGKNPSEILLGDYDLRVYHPEKLGLKDLVFEIRIKDLVKNLNNLKSYGKLSEVYFKVYWMYPGQYKISVNGLPNGFVELRNSLKNQIKSRLAYVIPLRISNMFRGYNLSLTTKANKKVIKLVSKVKAKNSRQINLTISSDGQLETIDNKSDFLKIRSTHKHVKKSWSQGKWVMNYIIEKRTQAPHVLIMTTMIKYNKIKKYGFPQTISIDTKHSILYPKKNKKNQKDIDSMETVLKFSKYEVNTGKAKKMIMGK